MFKFHVHFYVIKNILNLKRKMQNLGNRKVDHKNMNLSNNCNYYVFLVTIYFGFSQKIIGSFIL